VALQGFLCSTDYPGMWQAFTQAVRQIRRNRKMSLVIVSIMALCIGSCVSIFCMVSAVLLADSGYADPDRISLLWHARPNVAGVVGVGPGDFLSYRSSLQHADAIAAVTTKGFNLGGERAARVTCARMTDGMFPLLGVAPERGRWFTSDDDRNGAHVVVISHRLWATRMASQGDPIDQEVLLDAVPYRVIGMMPQSFTFPPDGIQGLSPAECWVPASFAPAELAIPSFSYVIFTRLKAGVSLEQATSDAHAGAQRIWSTYPAAVQSQLQLTARMVPLSEQVRASSRTPLTLFAAAGVGLLLIGCANVSNLILTATDSRRDELRVRASLGASRRAILLQLLIESVSLAVIGALAGLLLAAALLAAMVATNATAFPGLSSARIESAAVLFAVLCGIVAGFAGALPSLAQHSTGDGQAIGLRAASRGLGGGVRGVLVAGELALAVIVLVFAGVLARSVASLGNVSPGFVAKDLLTFSVVLPGSSYRDHQSIVSVVDELLRRVRALPGVSAVAAASAPPVGEASPGVVFAPAVGAQTEYKPSILHTVTPQYNAAIGLSVVEGRFIEAADAPQGQAVAILNQTLARMLFPDGHPIGRTFFRIGSTKPHTVVGVVRDVRQGGPQRPAPPAVYLPLAQAEQPTRALNVALRSPASRADLSRQVEAAVKGIDSDVPLFALRTGADLLNSATASQRFNVLVVGVFAVFAVLLALGGLYAVLAHAIQQTRRDFGIRLALGATAVRIVRTVASRAAVPIVAGIVTGAAIAMTASGLIASLLFGVKPDDPFTLVAATMLVLLASMVAVLIPALRAARVDLVTLLRHD
jgi:predicted permease